MIKCIVVLGYNCSYRTILNICLLLSATEHTGGHNWNFSLLLQKNETIDFFFPVALQSLMDLGRLTYRRFLELFRQMVGLLGRVISPSQGLYLLRTTQHRKTRTNIHALSGIRPHDPSNQLAKTHASDRTATVTGWYRSILCIKFSWSVDSLIMKSDGFLFVSCLWICHRNKFCFLLCFVISLPLFLNPFCGTNCVCNRVDYLGQLFVILILFMDDPLSVDLYFKFLVYCSSNILFFSCW
jgi:hypothetical protein